MQYRRLGKTGCMVSEIGLGAEWLERHTAEECAAVVQRCYENGVNVLDCWMPGPTIRSNLGAAIRGHRGEWFIQGHIGATYQNGQYVRTRSLPEVKAAFEDLLTRLETDYIDFGMIHYVDLESEWDAIQDSPYMDYVKQLKADGVIRHIGLSTHNPLVAAKAVESGIIEMMLFSVNPAFDLMPPSENVDSFFTSDFAEGKNYIAPERERLYRLCEQHDVGITVMKGLAGGRLFDAARSPFGVALTPVQCIHYSLTRPGVASVLVGYDTVEHADAALAYETATEAEKDYASVLAGAPYHAFTTGQCTYCGHCHPCPANIDIAMVNKLYDLATMQPEVPQSVRAHYQALEVNASNCIGCRGCEKRCPFGVPIADRMKKAAELFK